MFFFQKKDNALVATHILCQTLGLRVTYLALKKQLENHPDYPSMLSVNEVLQSFQINTLVTQIPLLNLYDVPTPCLAALDTEGGIFAVISEVKDDFVEWHHTERGKQRESLTSFFEKWHGVLLLAHATELSGELDFLKNRRKEILIFYSQLLFFFIVLSLFSIIFFLLATTSNIQSINLFSILGVKLIGIIVSLFLIWHLIDKQNPFLKSICKIGKSVNCNSVLNSKAATIGGVLNWSEIGFFYFAGSFLALLLGLSNDTIIAFLAIINLFALPYTFFSVYYQGFILKNWCILCLSIQALLWLEFSLFYFSNSFLLPIIPDLRGMLLLIVAFTLPIVVWFGLKPLILLSLQTVSLKKTLKKYQNDSVIFQHLLSQQPRMFDILLNMCPIEFGNPDAQNVITVITNPYCPACAEKHPLIRVLIEQNKKNLKCQIIFMITNTLNNTQYDFFSHLFTLNKNLQIEALDYWFEMNEKDYEKWRLHFPINKIDEKASIILKKHEFWCLKSRIRATPTVFINGFQLPEVYQIEDIQRIGSRIFT